MSAHPSICDRCGDDGAIVFRARGTGADRICWACHERDVPIREAARALADRLDSITHLAVQRGEQSGWVAPPWARELAALREALGDKA